MAERWTGPRSFFWQIVFEVIDGFGRGAGAIGPSELRGRRRRHPIATSWAGGSEVHALSFFLAKAADASATEFC